MYDQFKVYRFDAATLRILIEELHSAGWDITEVWKKGIKKQEEPDRKTDSLRLKIHGKWFFRQAGRHGAVRLNKLDKDQEAFFLGLLKKHGLYTEPQWKTGIVLYIIYILLIFFVVFSRGDWLGYAFFALALCLTSFLYIAYLRSREKIPEIIYKISLVFGGLGYLLTAVSSALCLPLAINIFRSSLYNKISKV